MKVKILKNCPELAELASVKGSMLTIKWNKFKIVLFGDCTFPSDYGSMYSRVFRIKSCDVWTF